MTPPLLSIITVCRDHAEGLMRTAFSLPSPLPPEIEWLVQDGGSVDGGPERLAVAFPDATSIVRMPDGGPYDGMNRCIDRARGEWLLFLNAGDELVAPWPKLSRRLAASEAGLVYGDSLERFGAVELLKPARAATAVAWGMFAHHQAMLFRRKTVGALRFDPALEVGADYDFVLATLSRGPAEAAGFPICRFEGAGLSSRKPALGRADQRIARARRLGMQPLPNYAISCAQVLSGIARRTAPLAWSRLRGATRVASGWR